MNTRRQGVAASVLDLAGLGVSHVAGRPPRHIGLESTIERLRLAQGELTMNALPGGGTHVHVTAPAEPSNGGM